MTVNMFDFLTPAEIAAVQAYSFPDVTTAVATAIAATYRKDRLEFPAGGYGVDQIELPDDPGVEFRGVPFEMFGEGRGEAFVVDAYQRGTIVRGLNPTKPTLRVRQGGAQQSTGTINIHDFRFEGKTCTGVPVADIEALYGSSRIHDCDFYQSCVGDGLSIGFMGTSTVERCYLLNSDWLDDIVSPRTGTGIILRNDASVALAAFRKITSRGWEQAFDIGNVNPPDDGVITLSALLEHCECSNVTHGIWLRKRVWKAVVDRCYFEGVTGTCVLNEGDYNTIKDCMLNVGFEVGIDDSSASTIGTVISGNALQAADITPCTLIKVQSYGYGGGPGKTVRDNNLTWSGSGGVLTDVVGIEISGIDPRITINGNSFLPRGEWIGASDVYKIKDDSTSGDGASGSGLFGISIAASIGEILGGQFEVPMLSRGALSLAIDPEVLDEDDVDGGVLQLGELSVFDFTPASAVSVDRFAAANLAGKRFGLHITGGNATLGHGNYLRLAGSVDYAPPADGCWIEFQAKPDGTYYDAVYEVSRTEY